MLRRIKRQAPSQDYYYWRAYALQLALIATLVAGTFTDRLYGESGYWMIGLVCVLYRLQHTELAAATVSATTPAVNPVGRLRALPRVVPAS